MRSLMALIFCAAVQPAAAQLVVPLAVDGRVACTQGLTGIGRPPGWNALADTSVLGGWVLAETTADSTDLHFPLCVSPQTQVLDFEATLRFKPVAGMRARVGGLMFRAQNAADYDVVQTNALDNSLRLFRMQGGRRSQLAAKQIPVAAGEWHTLRVRAVGGRIEAWLDGAEPLAFDDRGPPPRPGAIGVWSHADSVTHYATLLVGPVPR